jgi:hypothetical protein
VGVPKDCGATSEQVIVAEQSQLFAGCPKCGNPPTGITIEAWGQIRQTEGLSETTRLKYRFCEHQWREMGIECAGGQHHCRYQACICWCHEDH